MKIIKQMDVPPDLQFYTILIQILLRHDPQEALVFFETFLKGSIAPDFILFNLLIKKFSQQGDNHTVRHLRKLMRKFRVAPNGAPSDWSCKFCRTRNSHRDTRVCGFCGKPKSLSFEEKQTEFALLPTSALCE